ncbi:MAG: HAMP domain-containing sensor histidine kinase [bacterium]
MINYWKQSVAWATRLKRNVFGRARITLTFYYILVIALVMGLFSWLLYFALVDNIQTDLKDQFYDDVIENEVYAQTVDHVKDVIVGGDISILIVFGFLSYFLANRTLNPIKKALDDQKNFSADASHELRTPLAVMQSEAEIILRNKKAGTEDYKKVVRSSLEEVDKMKKIIEDLLLMARSSHKTSSDTFTKVDLATLIQKILTTMKPVALVKNLSLESELGENIMINGNPYFLEHAINNIVGNAIKYTNNGNVIVKIYKNSKDACIEVRDSGIGISKKDIPHILNRFYKVSPKKSNDDDGAGLGLAIADKIIKDHGGKIDITSELGHGTVVTIRIPKMA